MTVAPEITAPAVSFTVALMVAELEPSAVRLAALDVTVTLPTVGATAPPTAYPVDALSPIAVAGTEAMEGTD